MRSQYGQNCRNDRKRKIEVLWIKCSSFANVLILLGKPVTGYSFVLGNCLEVCFLEDAFGEGFVLAKQGAQMPPE